MYKKDISTFCSMQLSYILYKSYCLYVHVGFNFGIVSLVPSQVLILEGFVAYDGDDDEARPWEELTFFQCHVVVCTIQPFSSSGAILLGRCFERKKFIAVIYRTSLHLKVTTATASQLARRSIINRLKRLESNYRVIVYLCYWYWYHWYNASFNFVRIHKGYYGQLRKMVAF